ncbi:UMP kinase [Marinihelvus fidelis]|uniref:Uridylate kinase n=1 Tax=Marinihelvus fidelis TaxID=2613842 RepID=A0A5N0T3G0_9GAMM|nr:UMP kinase [Marinihelvus fidelis]KAA9129610.1 UMP kinase [Marinihelvus fidelis]
MTKPVYKRILLKLSGEALLGKEDYGIDPVILSRIAGEIADVVNAGTEVAVVIGGGNIFRGAGLAESGIDRVTGDHMGMLATVLNALALQDSLESVNIDARVMSAVSIHDVCEDYIRRRAMRHLQKGRVVICAAGTGNPFFTTDTAAALRAIEIGADILLKATKVDGVYTADPKIEKDADRYDSLSYDEVIEGKLRVMDTNAIVLCRDQDMPIRVFNVFEEGNLQRLVNGHPVGSIVH